MKKLLAVLLVLALLLTGCGRISEAIDDPAIRADTEALLTAFVENDYAACRALVSKEVSDADLQSVFDSIHQLLAGMGSYEMTAVQCNRKVSDGRDVKTIRYLVQSEDGNFYLEVAKENGKAGIAGWRVTEAAEDAEPTNPAGLAHRIFTVIGALTLCFVFWMVIDCFRRKMKRKWLWVPLILLGMVMLTFTMKDGGFNFRFNVGLYWGLTNLQTYVKGGFRAAVYIPVAAIVYFFKRKDLTIKPEPEAAAEVSAHAEGEEEA